MPTGRGVKTIISTMKYPEIKETVRKLRHNTTQYEIILWRHLRLKQLDGRKFLRQHAIIYDSVGNEHFYYVPDFYCYSEKLAIELDGKIHDFTKERDRKRDAIFEDMGIKVIRFKNDEVIANIEDILERIKNEYKNG
jgi:very-short-patch-repair endonuclease